MPFIQSSLELIRLIETMIELAFPAMDYREIPLLSQGKRNHNICGVNLDCGSEVRQVYKLKYDRALKKDKPISMRVGYFVMIGF